MLNVKKNLPQIEDYSKQYNGAGSRKQKEQRSLQLWQVVNSQKNIKWLNQFQGQRIAHNQKVRDVT